MKIQGQNKQMLAAACQMFMGKSEPEIAQIALETLEGHQRAIIAHLTVEVRLRRVGRLLYHTAVDCSVLMKPSVCDARPSHRKSTRTGRSSRSRYSRWPLPTWSTWASAWSATLWRTSTTSRSTNSCPQNCTILSVQVYKSLCRSLVV